MDSSRLWIIIIQERKPPRIMCCSSQATLHNKVPSNALSIHKCSNSSMVGPSSIRLSSPTTNSNTISSTSSTVETITVASSPHRSCCLPMALPPPVKVKDHSSSNSSTNSLTPTSNTISSTLRRMMPPWKTSQVCFSISSTT